MGYADLWHLRVDALIRPQSAEHRCQGDAWLSWPVGCEREGIFRSAPFRPGVTEASRKLCAHRPTAAPSTGARIRQHDPARATQKALQTRPGDELSRALPRLFVPPLLRQAFSGAEAP